MHLYAAVTGTPYKQIISAFWDIIKPQIKAFQSQQFENNVSLLCPYSGITLYNNSYTHVDHDFNQLTFMKVSHNFMERYHLDYKDLNVSLIEGDITLKSSVIANDNHVVNVFLGNVIS